LRFDEVYERVAKLPLDHPPELTEDWIKGDLESSRYLDDRIQVDVVPISERDEPKMLLSLTELRNGEKVLAPTLVARAKTQAPALTANWVEHLRDVLGDVDLSSERAQVAIREQAAALESITRK